MCGWPAVYRWHCPCSQVEHVGVRVGSLPSPNNLLILFWLLGRSALYVVCQHELVSYLLCCGPVSVLHKPGSLCSVLPPTPVLFSNCSKELVEEGRVQLVEAVAVDVPDCLRF